MRARRGRLVIIVAGCAAIAAAPASIAQATAPGSSARATAPGATLSLGKRHRTATTVKKLTTEPARPARSAAHVKGTPRGRHHASGLRGRVTAHVAGDPGVTIADFHFSPATTTIHVGDTITWSNSGPSSHTATARNGSFNTGILKKGQSASHTFTQPGTYSYICQIHTFMHGTIVVLASTTSTTTSPASSTPTTPTAATKPAATTAAAQAGPTLPNTGFDVAAGLFTGVVLLGLGASLRRARPR